MCSPLSIRGFLRAAVPERAALAVEPVALERAVLVVQEAVPAALGRAAPVVQATERAVPEQPAGRCREQKAAPVEPTEPAVEQAVPERPMGRHREQKAAQRQERMTGMCRIRTKVRERAMGMTVQARTMTPRPRTMELVDRLMR